MEQVGDWGEEWCFRRWEIHIDAFKQWKRNWVLPVGACLVSQCGRIQVSWTDKSLISSLLISMPGGILHFFFFFLLHVQDTTSFPVILSIHCGIWFGGGAGSSARELSCDF